jgi:hypothetical protein
MQGVYIEMAQWEQGLLGGSLARGRTRGRSHPKALPVEKEVVTQ